MEGTSNTSCARCHRSLDPSTATMSGDGPICNVCEQIEQRAELAASSSSSSMSPLVWAAISLVCNVMFIPSVLAIVGGWQALKRLDAQRASGEPAFNDSDQRTKAIFAIVLGAAHPVLVLGLVAMLGAGAMIGAISAASAANDYESAPYYDENRDLDGYEEPAPPTLADDLLGHRVVHLEAGQPFSEQLAAHVAEAQRLGLRPYVFATATWCPPCNAVERHAHDPQMIEAYRGTYILHTDIDLIDNDAMQRAGFEVIGVPTWYGVDGSGRFDGRTISSSMWGEDVPANMAPPLSRFFRGENG